MEKQHCIFDADGTLLDSMPYWQELLSEFLTGKGLRDNVAPALERVKSMPPLETATVFVQEFGIDGTPKDVMQEIRQTMAEHYRSDIDLKPGIRKYLTVLKNRGVRMCVATATPEVLIQLCLERLGIADFFEFILSCETVGAGKDRPDVFYEAAHRLGDVAPSEIAVFEDSFHALQTAARAGFYTVSVYDASGADQWDDAISLSNEYVREWRTEDEL